MATRTSKTKTGDTTSTKAKATAEDVVTEAPEAAATDVAEAAQSAAPRNTGRGARASAGGIDFSKPSDPSLFHKDSKESPWSKKLRGLIGAVADGTAQQGDFFCVGSFSSPSGARNVLRTFEKDPSKLPGEFVFQTRIVYGEDGSKGSELHAAIPA